MSKFTKGKWEYSDDTNVKIPETLYFSPIRNWFRVFNRKKKIGIALVPEEANARLIAAAPEMYQHLKLILNGEFSSDDVEQLLARIDGEEQA